jgi:hypothetical protein
MNPVNSAPPPRRGFDDSRNLKPLDDVAKAMAWKQFYSAAITGITSNDFALNSYIPEDCAEWAAQHADAALREYEMRITKGGFATLPPDPSVRRSFPSDEERARRAAGPSSVGWPFEDPLAKYKKLDRAGNPIPEPGDGQ